MGLITMAFWMGLVLIVLWTSANASIVAALEKNNRPIIGVLSQELSPTVSGIYPNYKSYIAASYIKYLEGAGARVVPIWINREKSYYKNVTQNINGLLLPGGAASFNATRGYAEAGAILFQYAKELNRQGDYFPVWGTCLGFELLTYLAAGQREPRSNCSSENVSLPLHFKPDYFNSRMFKNTPADIIKILASQNVTANFHSFCVTEEMLISLGLDRDWHVLTTNFDANGIEFVSSIESRHYPFYGVQYHPEKNGYEFKPTKNIPHSSEAVRVMQFFANFFVDQARKSHHTFTNTTVENSALIYNYPPTYTEDHLSFEQCYLF